MGSATATSRRVGIRLKLVLFAAVAFLSALAVGFIGWRGLHQLNQTSLAILAMSKASSAQQDADMMHDALRADVFAAMLATEEQGRQGAKADVGEHSKTFREAFARNSALLRGTPVAGHLAAAGPKIEQYIVEAERLVNASLVDPAAGRAGMSAFIGLFGQLEQDMSAITEALQAEAETIRSEGTEGVERALLVASAIAAGLLLCVSIVMSRSIERPLRQAARLLEAVAERDFTQRLEVQSSDEVGQMASALNHAVDNMRRALLEVRGVSDGLGGASAELSAAAHVISGGAQAQAASLEETASSMQHITVRVKQSADNARQASQLAAGSRQTAENGGAVVAEAVQAMAEINVASRRIAEIISTIDEIAFQTNLLALNAAVEAARAGDQGRGFAVVATEVRTLAQRSALAAKEIKGLIDDSVRKVERGSALVNRSGETLNEIVLSVRKVTDIVDEMAAASGEQSAGIDQVNQAVAQMDGATQNSASQTEQMAATAESLTDQAERLRALVANFRLGDGHAATAAAAAPAGRALLRAAPPARATAYPAGRRGAPMDGTVWNME